MTRPERQTLTGSGDRSSRALAFGIAIPFVYFGIQIVAARFYPGYSFFNRDASTLGSEGSTAPWIFNVGTLAVGLCEVVAAWGFLRGLPRVRAGALLAWATCVALVSAALGSLNAFLHPLPDPRHTEGVLSILGAGVLLLPVITGLILWRLRGRALVTPALVLSVLVWLILIPIMSGLVQRLSIAAQIDMPRFQAFLNGYHGVLQRIAAAAVFGPVAFAAWLLRRFSREQGAALG
jgi:hypothetical protein